jgi:hypothetical protein
MTAATRSTMDRGLLLLACVLAPAIPSLIAGLAEFSPGVSFGLVLLSGAILILSFVVAIFTVRKFDNQTAVATFNIVLGLTVLIGLASVAAGSFLQNDFLVIAAAAATLSLVAIGAAIYVRLAVSATSAFQALGKTTLAATSSEISLILIVVVATVIALSNYNFEISLRQAARYILLIALAPWCLSQIYDGLISIFSRTNFDTQ